MKQMGLLKVHLKVPDLVLCWEHMKVTHSVLCLELHLVSSLVTVSWEDWDSPKELETLWAK